MLEMFAWRYTNTKANFILTLPMTLKKRSKWWLLISSDVHNDVTDFEVSGFICLRSNNGGFTCIILQFWTCVPWTQRQPSEVFYKKVVLKNFAKFTGKYLCQSFFFNNIADAACKFLRTPFLQNATGRLLLWTGKKSTTLVSRPWGGRAFCSPHPSADPKRPILNRVKILTLFRMGLFGSADGWGEQKALPPQGRLTRVVDFFPVHRRSRPVAFCKKGVLKNLQAASAILLKKKLWHRYFPVNFAKFLRTTFL